jgi:glycosyltransferase involved in cell wall biosynthesis
LEENSVVVKVLFYNDAKHVGGHEMLAIELIKNLSRIPNYKISFICSSDNYNLIESLNLIPAIEIYLIPFSSERFQGIKTFFSFKKAHKIKSIINKINPVVSIVVQGNIELGSLFLYSKVLFHFETIVVTYIPLTSEFNLFSSNLIARALLKIKDCFNIYYFSIPDFFVVISDRSIFELRKLGKRVIKIENGIEFSLLAHERTKHLDILNVVSANKFVIAIVGRVEFKHKGQDKILRLLDEYRDELKNFEFLIIGDGKDLESFIHEIDELEVSEQVKTLGWLSKDQYLSLVDRIDMVLIPSNFEGVPLVLLESFYLRLNIIGSRIPGIEEYLPSSHTFGNNIHEMYNCILRNMTVDMELLNKNYDLVVRDNDLEVFNKNWIKFLSQFLND